VPRPIVDRQTLPQPGPSPAFRAPVIERSALPTGLQVWSVHHPAVPVVSLMLMVARGAADDPPGQDGLAALVIDMLDEGSLGRSAIEMHEELARLGAHLDSDVGSDAATLGLSVLTRFVGPALQLLADMIVRPSLLEADFTRVRQLRLHRLTQLRDMPSAVADRTFTRLVYGRHPYGHTPLGSEAALGALGVDDVRAFHLRAIVPREATLIAVGDCTHDEIHRLAAEAFDGWIDPPLNWRTAEDVSLPRPSRVNVVPRPGAAQSELRIGHVAVPRSTPDYHALIAANMILGGQFVSRINQNLREDKGVTYGARTAFDFRRMAGPFLLQASVQTEATSAAIRESLDEIAAIRGPRPATDEELALGVAALTRGYARNFETADQIGRALTQIALFGLSDNYFAEFVPTLERITVEDVTAAAARHLDPPRLAALVVGDLDRIGPDLDALGLGEPVILSADAS
jgi:zinc protease